MIPQETIDRIVERADDDLLRIIEQLCPGTSFERRGASYAACCPFHHENTPSFYVHPGKKTWACFGSCNEAGGALKFVMKHENLKYIDAVRRLAELTGIPIDDKKSELKAKFEKVAPVAEHVFEFNDNFSDFELQLLGNLKHKMRQPDGNWETEDTITSEKLMRDFPIKSVKSMVIPAKAGETYSWKISSTPEFPIMCYYYENTDGTSWGRIYQPCGDKDRRFSFFGNKPKDFIFSDNKVAKMILNLKHGKTPDEKLKSLIIVSGGSDAINTHFNGGFNVCWLNSESELLQFWQYKMLQNITSRIYVLYDLDPTGIRFAYKMALTYLDIIPVFLPSIMYERTGGRCKDVKDFFLKWSKETRSRDDLPSKPFDDFKFLVERSLPLKFWMDKTKEDNEGNIKVVGVEIDNEQLYSFLRALGICINEQDNSESEYVHIHENIVERIPEKDIKGYINQILREFIRSSPRYFDKQVLNAIHRSNQLRGESLKNLSKIELNFKIDTRNQDFIFFRNGALRVTRNAMEMVPLESLPFYLYKDKIIDHDFRLEKEPLFYVGYSRAYIENDEKEDIPDYEKYTLKKNFNGFSFAQFVYNTGRMEWRDEEEGKELTPEQKAKDDLNFISKVCGLGYGMRKHKESSNAYALFATEGDIIRVGVSQGGVGKSLFYEAFKCVRNVLFRDGQAIDPKKEGDLLYTGVIPGLTDIVRFEDLQRGIPMHPFFNQITGHMTVRNRFKDPISIPYEESPVTVFNSNHTPSDIDDSSRRRAWFLTFSSYYHPKNSITGQATRSPRTEFGKDLICDYTPDEMNHLYNFMATCLQTYMRFPYRIEPDMQNVNKRILLDKIGATVFDWMNDYFDEGAEINNKLNRPVWRSDMFEDYKMLFAPKFRDSMQIKNFRDKLENYCTYRKWILNPKELYRNKSEEDRVEYRMYRNGKDDFFWFIQTRPLTAEIRDCFFMRKLEPLELITDSSIRKEPYGTMRAPSKEKEEQPQVKQENLPF